MFLIRHPGSIESRVLEYLNIEHAIPHNLIIPIDDIDRRVFEIPRRIGHRGQLHYMVKSFGYRVSFSAGIANRFIHREAPPMRELIDVSGRSNWDGSRDVPFRLTKKPFTEI